MIKFKSLFSGSKGNSSLIQSDKANVLLDVGFGYKNILDKLQKMNLTPQSITAIVITHEHSDHIAALPFWTKNCATKIYAPRNIADYIRQRAYCSEVEEVDGDFEIEDISVSPYCCSHDAIWCNGYRFTAGGESIASVTDTGCWSQDLIDFLYPCKAIQLESNHDVNMLTKGSYSWYLKRRILSDYGHLSNDQTGQILEKLYGSKVKTVVLAHLSENNNSKEIAFDNAVKSLAKSGVIEGKDVKVYVATQNGLEVTIE